MRIKSIGKDLILTNVVNSCLLTKILQNKLSVSNGVYYPRFVHDLIILVVLRSFVNHKLLHLFSPWQMGKATLRTQKIEEIQYHKEFGEKMFVKK